MGQNLTGVRVPMFGRNVDAYMWPVFLATYNGPTSSATPVGPSNGVPFAFPSGTPTLISIGASDSTKTVPIGAKNWSYAILTGTGTITINGVSVAVPAPFSQSSLTTLAGLAISVVTDATSSGMIYYES